MGKIAIVDCRADNKTIYSLEDIGLTVIPTAKTDLYDAIATHADIQIHYLVNDKFICAPEVFAHYRKLMNDDIELIKGSAGLGKKYPYDIPYNAAVLDDYVICNSAYTAIEILSEYKAMSKKILNVRQGYSKCNICTLTGNAMITSDNGIAKKASENRIDVIRIRDGFIKLRNLSYGFIGGATGLVEKKLLAVNGEIKTHPDTERIKLFCKSHGTELIELKTGILEDIGSIIVNL
ncbi:MAG: hypothetical protein J1F01_08730 [Oscillospiraceae bacterium]|nr:hypothetical protein [Oscillospiraceae bacterium]